MRKVLYVEDGLHLLSNGQYSKSGYFHGFSDTSQNALAIIEDVTTGYVHKVETDNFRFVTPPENIISLDLFAKWLDNERNAGNGSAKLWAELPIWSKDNACQIMLEYYKSSHK